MILTKDQQKSLKILIISQWDIVARAYKNRKNLETTYKSDGQDFATETDLLVEKNLTKGILDTFPDAIICGEEYGLTEEIVLDRPIFVIDPIDGTKYFRYGMSLFTISIGIQFAGENIYGLIYNPLSGDMIAGWSAYGVSDQFGEVLPPKVESIKKTQIYYDTVGIHEVSKPDQERGLELISRINIEAYRSRSAGASCLFAFGAVSGLFGAMVDIYGGVKITDQIWFFAILRWLGWEVREVRYGDIVTKWVAPAYILDELVTLIP